MLNLLFVLSHEDMHKKSKQCHCQSELHFLPLIRGFIEIIRGHEYYFFVQTQERRNADWKRPSKQAHIWKFCFYAVDMEICVYMCLRHVRRKTSPSALAWQLLKSWETSMQRVLYQYIWKGAGSTSPLDLHLLLVWQPWVNVWASRQWANMMGSSLMQINEIW